MKSGLGNTPLNPLLLEGTFEGVHNPLLLEGTFEGCVIPSKKRGVHEVDGVCNPLLNKTEDVVI